MPLAQIYPEFHYMAMAAEGMVFHCRWQADARLLAVNKLNQDHLTQILSPDVAPTQKTELADFLTDNLNMSGYTDKAILQRGLIDPENGLLQKPFTLDILARKLRAVLDDGSQKSVIGYSFAG